MTDETKEERRRRRLEKQKLRQRRLRAEKAKKRTPERDDFGRELLHFAITENLRLNREAKNLVIIDHLVERLVANPDCPGVLQMIVADMPREVTGIEVAFLQHMSFAAQAGAWRAHQISAFWASKRAEEMA